MSRDAFLVALSLLIWGIGESAYIFFQPLYLEQLGASPIAIGTILGSVGVAMTVSHMPAGYLADRFGRRQLMIAAWILGSISGIIMAAAQSLSTFSFGIVLYGVTAFVVSPMNSYITAARGKWSVTRAITFNAAFYNIGAIIGPFIGGQIGNRLGLSKIYVFSALVFLISTLIIVFIRPQPVKFQRNRISVNLLNRRYLGFMPVFFLTIFAAYLSQPLAPNFLQNVHTISIDQIGTLGSLSSFGTVLLNLGFGFLNPLAGLFLGQMAAGIFTLSLWYGTGLPWFALGYFFLGSLKVTRSMGIALISDFVTPENLGLAYGIAESVGGLAMIAAPPIAGLLYEQNPVWIFQSSALLLLISLVSSAIFSQKSQPRLNIGEKYGSNL